ncbi:MAG: class E sortase [Lachnospiraceae bacterium]|nr:class E sortase [Lachnospiraceae bacterium]
MTRLKRFCAVFFVIFASCFFIYHIPYFQLKTYPDQLQPTTTPKSQANTLKSSPTITPAPTLDLYSNDPNLPYDKLFITKERQNYNTGDLVLIIPKLSLKEAIQNGTETDDLAKGPGLYDYAQLPGEGNRNVSIAAHRNKSRNGVISEWFFYYIDTLCTGDYIYLRDDQYIYRYIYDQTTIVEDDDWSPIYSQGFSCVTLTSCEPIGVATHRIIVRGKLDAITPHSKDYAYLASITSS